MSDAAFREALDAYGRARVMATNLKCTWPEDAQERREALTSAEARVLALYAERQGEEAVVTDGTPDGQYIELRFVQSTRITDGDRVWVTKVEEGQ